MSSSNSLIRKLESFISKYYKNLLIRGVIYFFGTSLAFFLLISIAEYFGNFNIVFRTILFWCFIICVVIILWYWVITPLKGLFRLGETLSKRKAAEIIGTYFVEVEDKLLNLLELSEMNQKNQELIDASIKQKTKELSVVPFLSAINFSENKKYLAYGLLPFFILLCLFLSGNKSIITESSSRIIAHNTAFQEKSPFVFTLHNDTLTTIKGRDFLIRMSVDGEEIPANVYVKINGRKHKMKSERKLFIYAVKKPQKDFDIQFWADGFYSKRFSIQVTPNPIIKSFLATITPPKYTNLKKIKLKNNGNIKAPEGSSIEWVFKTESVTDFIFLLNKHHQIKEYEDNVFKFQKQFFKSVDYGLFLKNNYLTIDSVFYNLNIIPDYFPEIKVSEMSDTNNLYLKYFQGIVKDDYKISKLTFNHRIARDSVQEWTSLDVSDNIHENHFFYHWDISATTILDGESIEYFFETWDNDQINGHKSARSRTMKYTTNSSLEKEKKLVENNSNLKNNIESAIALAEEIENAVQKTKKELLNNKDLSWKEKQKAASLIKKQKKLSDLVEKIQKDQLNNQKKENQSLNPDEELLKKQKLLEELFKNIMSEEMKELISELNEIIEDVDKEELRKILNDMQDRDENLKNELDRSLELFKQLEVEQKIESAIKKLEDLAKEQLALAEKTKEKKSEISSTKAEQEKIKLDFENIQKTMEDATKLNKELEEKHSIPDTKDKEDAIKTEMQNSIEKLDKKMQNKASEAQKKAGEKMKEMANELEQSMTQSGSDSIAEDMNALRQILENLISFSLDQESLMINLSDININSPSYVLLIQKQKKLEKNTEIIKDSLFALSKRQPQISAIINKEIGDLNRSLEKSLIKMEERYLGRAQEHQQFSMTTSNNLALLLSETLKQMQKDLSQQSDSENKKMCNKPNSTGGQGLKELKGLQEQLKKQLEKMQKAQNGKGGDQGKKRSKELAQMAAKQEMIRKRMQEIRKSFSENKAVKRSIDEMIQEMEETENDIINKNINLQTIIRQKEIITRLLDAEKSQREQDKEDDRESSEWLKEITNNLINPFEKYQKEKLYQQELLQTVPPSLAPFYKKKVNNYFRKTYETE